MTVVTSYLPISTRGDTDIHDVSDAIVHTVEQSGLKNGIVTIFCPSSTSAVTTIEYEPGCLADLRRLFDEITDPCRPYTHDVAWGDGNGHSHLRAALLKASLTVPFTDGHLLLGTYQQIIYIDFDNKARKRELVVQILGE